MNSLKHLRLIKQSTQEVIKSIHEKTEHNQIIKFKNENFTKDVIKNILIDSITAIQNNSSYNSSNYTINFIDAIHPKYIKMLLVLD